MKVSPVSSEEGGKVLFSCPRGYTLSGDREASCQASNKWSIKVASLFCHGKHTQKPIRIQDGIS